MSPIRFVVENVAGVAHSEKRAVAFLRGHHNLSAGIRFDAESANQLGKRLRHKMALWIAFQPDTKGKFHRFKNEERKYRDCFVFIDLEEQVRLYGFTCNPKADKRFELVLLISWVQKKTRRTDYAELDRVLEWKDYFATQDALQNAFSHGVN